MTTLRLLPDLEDALRRIPGIRAASVVTGPDARPTEIHIVADPGKAAKQVVRDVQSVAMAQFDVDVDHRIVSVVQIGGDEPGMATEPLAGDEADSSGPRAALTGITVRTRDGECEVTVSLAVGEADFTGTASGPISATHRARITAAATVRALSELLGITTQVESSQVHASGRHAVAVSVLTMSVPRLGEQALCGSALVRGDDEDAVARSVLAAVNRRLSG
ncbi:MAG: hypothetical protein EPO13_02715 [Actinomycetota bacterium]|nr:MAG: hypothetical protein EPO13_02715 [Actinomycetota bacterium]